MFTILCLFHGSVYDAHCGVIAARSEADEKLPDYGNPIQHYWLRQGKCGSAALLHARAVMKAERNFISDPGLQEDVNNDLVKHGYQGNPIPIMSGGCNGWVHYYSSNETYDAYIFLGDRYVRIMWNSFSGKGRNMVFASEHYDFVFDHTSSSFHVFRGHQRWGWVNTGFADFAQHSPEEVWAAVQHTVRKLQERDDDISVSRVDELPTRFTSHRPRLTYDTSRLINWFIPNQLLEAYESYTSIGLVSRQVAGYFSDAYLNAFDNLPSVSCNSVANVLEVIDLATGLFTGDVGSLGKLVNGAGDAWLKYRYVYNTTKSDLSEYASLLNRFTNLSETGSRLLTTHGRVVGKDNIVYTCSITYNMIDIVPKDFCEWCKAWGLKLSAYNVWDMIPYSFIVDWFLHVGDMLHTAETWASAQRINPVSVWYTARGRNPNDPSSDVFLRLPGSGVPSAPPHYSYSEASGRTILKRATDVLALMSG